MGGVEKIPPTPPPPRQSPTGYGTKPSNSFMNHSFIQLINLTFMHAHAFICMHESSA